MQPRGLRPPDEGGGGRQVYPRHLEPGTQPRGLRRLLHLAPDFRGAGGLVGRRRVRGRRQAVVLQRPLRPRPDGSCRGRPPLGGRRSGGSCEFG